MSLTANDIDTMLPQFALEQGENHGRARAKLNTGEQDLGDDLGAQKLIPATSATPRWVADSEGTNDP